MGKRIVVPWTDEERAYLRKRVVKDKIHPFDVWDEMLKKNKKEPDKFRKRTYVAIKSRCKDLAINYEGLVTKEAKKRKIHEKTPRQQIKEDVEKAKLQQKVRELSRKYDVLIGAESLGERMERVLREEVKHLPEVNIAWKAPSGKKTKETAVLLLGDFHCGEEVIKEEVGGFGEYNFDIFVKRIKFLAASIKSIAVRKLKGYKIKKLCIFGLGDWVSGRIHDELIERAEDIIFQTLQGAYVIAQFVQELSLMFDEIEIDGVVGNHGRITQKKRHKRRYTNWDFVMYQYLAMFLAVNSRIKCCFPKSFFHIKRIYDWNFLMMHGDNIKSWMRIPWYGIERAMWRLDSLLGGQDIKVQYRIIAHFHNTGELDRAPGETIINGSVRGGSEHSLISCFEFDRPTQLFFGVHKEIGMTWRYPLRLDLPEVEEMESYAYHSDLDAGKYMKEMLESVKDAERQKRKANQPKKEKGENQNEDD